MVTAVFALVGVLVCVLPVHSEVTPMPDFDVEKIAGKWYMIAFATNADWFVQHKHNMKMGTANLVATSGGDLDLTYANRNADGSCWRMTHLAKKTDLPGRFTFHSQRWNNDNDMRVVDAKYDEYAIVHTVKTKDGVSEVLNKLYGRTTELSAGLQERFRQFALETGVAPENVVVFAPYAECD